MMTDEEQKKIFSNNLNKYISLSGKQQKEVAEAVGTNPSTFNMWCKGNSMPGTGKIRALADYFRIGMSDLTDLKEEKEIDAEYSDVSKWPGDYTMTLTSDTKGKATIELLIDGKVVKTDKVKLK